MSGSRSRRKGHNFERWLANQLKDIWPDAKRGLMQTRFGAECADVEGTPYWWECKAGKQPSPRAALKQAAEATDGRPVIVVVKDDRQEPFAVMPWSDFLNLIQQIRG